MDKYPILDERHKEKLLRAMCEQIAKRPGGWRNGFWSVAYPSNVDMRLGYMPAQREYVAELGADGVVIVRTLDGDEVTRGALGWIWNTPIFRAYRAHLDLASKEY